MTHVVLKAFPDARLAERWNAFLGEAHLPTHYVTPNYFVDAYVSGDRFAVLAVDDAGEITAVSTGVLDKSSAISGMFSRPQTVFRRGTNKAAAMKALSEGLVELAGEHSLSELYSWEQADGFGPLGMAESRSNDSTSVVMLDLSVGPDVIFSAFSRTRRNEIRKWQKLGVVEIKPLETNEELTDLYRIQCDWKARKGHPDDSLERMRTAVAQTGNRRVIIAKVEGKTVAGSFYRFCPGGVVEYSANFSIPDFQKFRPNDLIGWEAILWACRDGFSHFSMGGSHLFLRRFGGETLMTFGYRRDTRKLSVDTLREGAHDVSVRIYQSLPGSVRSGVKKVLTWKKPSANP
jgi:hypothetical protein